MSQFKKSCNQWKKVLNNILLGVTGAGARDMLDTIPLHPVLASYSLWKAL